MPTSRPQFVLGRLLCLLAPSLAFAASEPAPSQADLWHLLASGNAAEAHAAFTGNAAELAPRERSFGEAIALLNFQPRTDARLRRASDLLDELAQGPEDRITVPALYLRARIDQIHRTPADVASALVRYDELFAKHPGHPLAQLGAVVAAMTRIYNAPDDALADAIKDAEQILPRLDEPAVRCGLHLVLANACVRLGDRDLRRALTHFEAARKIGVHSPKMRATVLASVGGLSEKFGRLDAARGAYEDFLAEFERDDRAHTVRERLAALKEGAK